MSYGRFSMLLAATLFIVVISMSAAEADASPIAFADGRLLYTIGSDGTHLTRIATAREAIFAPPLSTAHNRIAYGVRNRVWVVDPATGSAEVVLSLRRGTTV